MKKSLAMKKIFVSVVIAIIVFMAVMIFSSLFCSCNRAVFDEARFSFDKAIIKLPNDEIIEGKVQSWKEFENSDVIQVKIDNVIYYTYITNVCLIKGEKRSNL